MNIVLSGNFEWTQNDIDFFSENGANTVLVCRDNEINDSIDNRIVDVVFCNWFFKYHNLIEFSNLKYIQLLSSGNNGIDVDYVYEKGIELHNARDVYSIPISEFVIGNVLSLYKKLRRFHTNQSKQIWEKNRDLIELYGKKVLIVGTGSIGKEIAKRMSAFTPFVYGCNRTVRDNPYIIRTFALTELQEIISEFDIIIISIALTKDTRHIFNKQTIEKMKETSLLVNVSRGEIIDESSLITFLSENKFASAVLDVFEQEPLNADNPLWNLDNAIITPHNAFVSSNNVNRLRKVIIDNYKIWRERYGKREN